MAFRLPYKFASIARDLSEACRQLASNFGWLEENVALSTEVEEVADDLADHIADPTAAHAASAISVADAANDFTATDVEGALAELQSDHEADAQALTDHIADPTAAHAGTAIANTPAGTIAATTVQDAINELDTEKAAITAAVMDGDTAGGDLSGTYPNPTVGPELPVSRLADGAANDILVTAPDGTTVEWVSGLTNAHIAAAAAIAVTKLATGSANTVFQTDGTTNAFTKIFNAHVSTSAEIEVSKLADGAANDVLTTNADGVTVNWTSGLTNAHIAAAAEIAVSKLADGNAGEVIATAVDGVTVQWQGLAGLDVVQKTVFDTKGDLPVATGADTYDNLPAGTNGHVLTADSSQTMGMKWATEVRARSFRNGAGPSMAHNTWTKISLDTESTMIVSSASMADTANGQIDITEDGTYLVVAQVAHASSVGGQRVMSVEKNSAGTHADANVILRKQEDCGDAGAAIIYQGGSEIVDLVNGDHLELFALQSTGGTVNPGVLVGQEYYCSIAVYKLGASS